jgi:tryptophan synthase beta chain
MKNMDITDPVVRLPPEKMPKHWINLAPIIGYDLPLISPRTLKPSTPDEAMMIFPTQCVLQEVSAPPYNTKEIEIPKPLREAYFYANRPTPLQRAYRLEKLIGVEGDDIKIYYKREDVTPTGSHKVNTALAQTYYAKEQGIKAFATETGAGQWGSALSYACALMGLECRVYMVRASYRQKPYRGILMRTYGSKVWESPSQHTEVGKKFYDQDPDHPGSLGIAISEAVEDCVTNNETTRYSLGSVVNFVLLHQTIVGQEAKKQLAMAGEEPDVLIGCIGGGSNFAGFSFPFVPDKLAGKDIRIIAVEPESCPSVTRGEYRYDFGDTAETTPLLKMHTLGHTFVPPKIHSGGLRYHGMAPLVSALTERKIIEATRRHQVACFEAAVQFASTEGIVPAPETSHAIKVAVDEALECKKTGEPKVIAFNFSGHGHFDMSAYDAYFAGTLEDFAYPEQAIREAMAKVPVV